MMRPTPNRNTKTCLNCGWFKKPEGKGSRICTNPEPMSFTTHIVEVEGDTPIVVKEPRCWLDCGLLERGLVKSIV